MNKLTKTQLILQALRANPEKSSYYIADLLPNISASYVRSVAKRYGINTGKARRLRINAAQLSKENTQRLKQEQKRLNLSFSDLLNAIVTDARLDYVENNLKKREKPE